MNDNTLFENMEILKEKFGITYKEAKEVLEKNDNDLIESLIYLEEIYDCSDCCCVGKDFLYDLKKKVVSLYKEGTNQRIIIRRKGNVLADIPLTAAVIGSFVFVLYPILLPLKVGGILLFDLDIEVTDQSGKVYNVNSNVKQKVSNTWSISKEKFNDMISNADLKVKADGIKTKAFEFGKKAMDNFNSIVENKITNSIKDKSTSYAKFVYDVENDTITEEFNNENSEEHEFVEIPQNEENVDKNNSDDVENKQEMEEIVDNN